MKIVVIKLLRIFKFFIFITMLIWISDYVSDYHAYCVHQEFLGKSGFAIDQVDRSSCPFENPSISGAPHLIFLAVPEGSAIERLQLGYKRGFPLGSSHYVTETCVNKVFWNEQYILSYYMDGTGKEWPPYYITTVKKWKLAGEQPIKVSDCFRTQTYKDRHLFDKALDSLEIGEADMDSLFYRIKFDEAEDEYIYGTKWTWRKYE